MSDYFKEYNTNRGVVKAYQWFQEMGQDAPYIRFKDDVFYAHVLGEKKIINHGDWVVRNDNETFVVNDEEFRETWEGSNAQDG